MEIVAFLFFSRYFVELSWHLLGVGKGPEMILMHTASTCLNMSPFRTIFFKPNSMLSLVLVLNQIQAITFSRSRPPFISKDHESDGLEEFEIFDFVPQPENKWGFANLHFLLDF